MFTSSLQLSGSHVLHVTAHSRGLEVLERHEAKRPLPVAALPSSKEASAVCYSVFSLCIILCGAHQPHSQKTYQGLMPFLSLFLCVAWSLCPLPISFKDRVIFWDLQVFSKGSVAIFSLFIYNMMRMRLPHTLSSIWPILWPQIICLN